MSYSRPTIYDVARAAGVSKSLVSLVLRGSDGVSKASREAVEQAIRELGYRPSRAAADLAARRTGLVAVLIDDYSNPWFVGMLRGATRALAPDGYRLTVVDSSTGPTGEGPVDVLMSMRADGIIVARDMPPSLIAVDPAPPIVVVGTRTQVPAHIDAVANDDAAGAQLVADHLLSLGHRVTAHLSAAGGAARARRDSFVSRMRSAGADVVLTDYNGPATEDAGFDTSMRLLVDHPEVTALFAANDVMAIGALGAARELGIVVPQDLAVVGYDNTALSRTRIIDLTTVDDSGFIVGGEAGKLLRGRMSGAREIPRRVLLAPVLIQRGSTLA